MDGLAIKRLKARGVQAADLTIDRGGCVTVAGTSGSGTTRVPSTPITIAQPFPRVDN